MSKVLLVYLIPLLFSIVFAGKFLDKQEQIAYNKCMQIRSNNSYCKVLVWGR
jgi:hypothetical protein